jgi:hypothetical protein
MRIQRRGAIAGESSLKVNCSRKGLKKYCFFFLIEFYREELGGVVFEGVRRKGEGDGFIFY